MYKSIMVPVDLEHADRLEKALRIAADLASHYGSSVTYVSVAAATPGRVAHTPQEFQHKLEAFARSESDKYGHATTARALISNDPATDLDRTLEEAVHETGADLVVIASHIPGIVDAIWPSHGGRLASHSDVSVFWWYAEAAKRGCTTAYFR